MKYPIPDEALDDRVAIVGSAGSGKTYTASGAIERILDRKGRAIIIDPLGVWFGLRLAPDGRTPSQFNPVIFGGVHGDLPINEHAGALIGETVASMAESCIVDLSQIGTKNGERRFMLAFLTALYRKTNSEPVHIIFDEADMFAPQKLMDKEGDAAKLLGMMETIVRRGRIKGFLPWLITQRPAVLSKDVLSQADGIIAMKLTASQDRDAIGAWIEGQADKAVGKEILASLPSKQQGEGVVWIPSRGILKQVTFPVKATFDSSRTPKRGEKKRATNLKPLDLGALKDRLATITAETKANDPKELKAEIARLRKAANDVPKLRHDPAAVDEAFAKGLALGAEKIARIGIDLEKRFRAWGVQAESELAGFKDAMEKSIGATIKNIQANSVKPHGIMRENIPRVPARPTMQSPSLGEVKLPPGEHAVLVAAAQFGSVERDQLGVLTGYKKSSRNAYIQRLREKGFIEINGNGITLTEEGSSALPADYEPLPTGLALQKYWLSRLPEGEGRILQALIDVYPNTIARDDLGETTGFMKSTRNAYIQRMYAKRLVSISGSSVGASEDLFQ